MNFINLSLFSMLFLLVVFYGLSLQLRHLDMQQVSLVSFVQNNLVTYNVSITLNNLYNFGFLLAIFMVLQIVSGIILSLYYNFAFSGIIYIVKDVFVGWLFRYLHSMNCSMVHFLLVVHILRGIYYLSYLATPNIWLSGLILYILIVAVSFLGYVLPYGQMSYWGATVITNIVALVPNVMELLLGNYVMSTVTLKRFYVLHFLLSLLILLVMIIHIVYLHKLGSTNPLYTNTVKVGFYPYFYAKDVYIIFLFLALLGLNYFNFVELSHSDNNIEVNPLVTPLHIVPEWYFLAYYTILKCINAKVAGILILVSFFCLLFNVVIHNYPTVMVFSSQNLYILMDWFALYAIMMFIGAKLPLAIYLYLAKLYILMVYGRMFQSHTTYCSANLSSVGLQTYFAINAYAYYYSAVNLLLYLQYAILQTNLEWNEPGLNYYVLLLFVIFSEVGLFLSFFCLLFDTYSFSVDVNHYHLYYIGLLILCHASLFSNVYILFMLSYFFINLQILEYRHAAYTLSYNTYWTLFYVITTLHLLHVLVGVYLLLYLYNTLPMVYGRSAFSAMVVQPVHGKNEYPVVVNLYWNFVEVLWLLIFFLYSWYASLSGKTQNHPVAEYSSLNHKVIGFNYFLLGAYFGLVAILYSVLIRIELFSSGNRIIFEQNNFIYNYLISLHGLLMIFFFVMPMVFSAFGNVYFPLSVNSPELKLAKLNNLSLIFLMVSFLLALNSSLLEFGIGVGWTLYPPLSTYSVNLSKLSLELVLFSLIFNGLASLLSSINFFISLFYMMNIHVVQYLNLYAVAVLLSSYMLILSLPVLTCGILSVLLDIMLNTVLLDPAFGGDPLFYQHLFWFFGHPEVYIMIVPSFGLFNQMLQASTQKPTFGASSMNLALVGITFLGFVVWAHHMYTAGMEADSRAYFTATTVMIAIPTGTKLFNWVSNIYSYTMLWMDISAFYVFFVVIFIIGGASGVLLGNASLDILLHDTYYVVGHFHQVLAIAAVLAILLTVLVQRTSLHFLPVFANFNKSNYNFLFMGLFININLLFLNMLFLGFNVLPRRIPDYSDENNLWNMLTSFHSIALVVLLLLL